VTDALTPQQRAATQIKAVRAMAAKADPDQIAAAVAELMASSPAYPDRVTRGWAARTWLDPDVGAFLLRARTFTLAATAALQAVLDVHAPADPTGRCAACHTPPPCRTVGDLARILAAELNGPGSGPS
jgi:hypothetical protein